MTYNSETNEFEGAGAFPGLAQVMWHITDRCPLRCPYCFATKTSDEVGEGQVDAIVRALVALMVKKVDIGGGEPLVAGCLPLAVATLLRAGIAVTVTTSGAGPAEGRRWLVESSHRLSRVIVSVDGGADDHDAMRGRVGTYSTLHELAGDLRASGYARLRVNTVVTRRFAEPMFAQRCVEAVAALRPSEWCLIQPHPANKKAGFDDYATSDEFFREVVQSLKSSAQSVGVEVLSRTIANYSGYWVLYPGGTLRPHTDSAEDGPGLDLLSSTTDEILAAVKASPMWLPGL